LLIAPGGCSIAELQENSLAPFDRAPRVAQGGKLAAPEPVVPTPHHHHDRHHVRIRRRKKFWRRPSWWSTMGRSIIVVLLAVTVLFCMYLVWSGMVSANQ